MRERALSAAERLDWLRLARTPRVGPVTFAQLLRRYRDASAALAALPKLARRGGGALGKIPSVDEAQAEIGATEAADGVVLMACEPGFPRLLRALDPPPPLISVLGHARLLNEPSVAIVGSRNASAIGRRFAQDVARDAGAAGYVVVSGLARGIDAAAHLGSLATGTVAVVAGGLKHVYPPEHAELFAQIAAQGAVVSENPFAYEPKARDFPRRNRLISGLALGVVVVEAAERSGSLITARFAGEQGREVMAAPGSPLDPRARGANRLIRDGAVLIESGADVIDVLRGSPLTRTQEPDWRDYEEAPMDEAALEAEADRVRDRVFELLSPTPTHRDEIIRFAEASPAAVLAALVELELAGRAVLLPGGLVARGDGDA
jgi:DNA processing protein